MIHNKYSRLFQFTCRFVKYFFLVLIGFSMTFVLAIEVGYFNIAIQLFTFIFAGIRLMAIIMLCLIAVTMIAESLR
ncbi:MAG: hypothetical protein AAF349_04985 [Cyanobacteria bacterium P01_A01_bin.68]